MGVETIIALAGVAVAAAGTGATVYQGQKQADIAKDAAKDQSLEAMRQRESLAEKQRQEEATRTAQTAKLRQRISGSEGKKSTVLTAPLGLPALNSFSGSTYLGGGKT